MPSLAARAFISWTYQIRSAMTRRTNVPTMAAIHLAVQGMSSQGTASVGALMTSASWGTVNSNSLSLRPVFARVALKLSPFTFSAILADNGPQDQLFAFTGPQDAELTKAPTLAGARLRQASTPQTIPPL